MDPSTVTYRDADGDMVTVKFSKGIIDSQETLNAIFDFSEVEVGYGIKGYELKGISLGILLATPSFCEIWISPSARRRRH